MGKKFSQEPEVLGKVKAIAALYHGREDMLIQVLKDIQCITSNTITQDIATVIANEMCVPLSRVYELATFYAFFSTEKRGKYIIRVCKSSSCHVKGSKDVFKAFQQELGISYGETTPDGKFTLETCECLGNCDKSPSVMINDDIYGNLTPIKVKEIIAAYSSDALKKENSKSISETKVILRNAGKINPVSSKEYATTGGYEGLEKAIMMPKNEIVDTIKASGLRGRGGAGFPTGVKLSLTKETDASQKYIICNADEGEPGTNKDRVILENDPHSVFEGMAIAGITVGATKGFIYLRIEYPHLHILLKNAINDARLNGYLGKNIMGSNYDFDIELFSGAGAYVCGEETALLESIEGKRGEPRFKPPFPAVSGLWGAPTVVNNVETLANLPQIITKGSEWFKSLGTEKCPGTKLFTLCGNINNPGVYEFPMGVNLKYLFEEVGGGCPNGKNLFAIQTGGALGSILNIDQIDMNMDIESCISKDATLGSGAIMFLDDSNDFMSIMENIMEFFVHESCGKCTPCREGNTRLLEIITKFKNGTADLRDLDTLEDLSATIMSTSLCGLGQGSPTPILTSLKNFSKVYLNVVERGRK